MTAGLHGHDLVVESEPLSATPQTPHAALIIGTVLALSDFVSLTAALCTAYFVWRAINPQIPWIGAILLLVPVSCIVEFGFSGHYPGVGLTAVETLRRIWRGITLVFLLLTAALFMAKDSWVESRGTLFLAWNLALAITPVGRAVAGHILASRAKWGMEAILIGGGETGRAIIRNLKANKILGIRVVACLDDKPRPGASCEGVPIVGGLSEIGAAAERYRTRYAVVAFGDIARDSLTREFHSWSRIFPKIVVVSELRGISTLWTEVRDFGGLHGLEVRHNLLNRWNQRLKRCLDLTASALGLVAAAPLIGFSALWIKCVSPGKAFYSQIREGKDGRTIRVWKLRTMYPDAEVMLEAHLARDYAARQEWDRYCKLKQDPRVLPGIGRLLRKTSLDEIPQLWNVLKGEMSLVGPRPFPRYHNARFDPEFREMRTQVTPGLSGLWQVTARSDGDLDTQAMLDSYYIRNWSLWLDLYILIRTVSVVLTQAGSY